MASAEHYNGGAASLDVGGRLHYSVFSVNSVRNKGCFNFSRNSQKTRNLDAERLSSIRQAGKPITSLASPQASP